MNEETETLINKLKSLTTINFPENGALVTYEDVKDSIDPKRSLFFTVLTDKNYKINNIKNNILAAWGLDEQVNISEALPKVGLAYFNSESDLRAILRKGPWSYRNDLILTALGERNKCAEDYKFEYSPLWVQFHKIPPCSSSPVIDRKLGSLIEKVLEDGEVSATLPWRRFLRVKIEIPIDKPLRSIVSLILLNGEECHIEVKYERLPRYCTFCGLMGHSILNCDSRSEARRALDDLPTLALRSEFAYLLNPKFPDNLRAAATKNTPSPSSQSPSSSKSTPSSLSPQRLISEMEHVKPYENTTPPSTTFQSKPIINLSEKPNPTSTNKTHTTSTNNTPYHNLSEYDPTPQTPQTQNPTAKTLNALPEITNSHRPSYHTKPQTIDTNQLDKTANLNHGQILTPNSCPSSPTSESQPVVNNPNPNTHGTNSLLPSLICHTPKISSSSTLNVTPNNQCHISPLSPNNNKPPKEIQPFDQSIIEPIQIASFVPTNVKIQSNHPPHTNSNKLAVPPIHNQPPNQNFSSLSSFQNVKHHATAQLPPVYRSATIHHQAPSKLPRDLTASTMP